MQTDDRPLRIKTSKTFLPFRRPSRYKAAFGGRGSGKSHTFAKLLIEKAFNGRIRAVCIREVQNTIKDSVHQLLCDKIESMGLGAAFEITDREIRTANGSMIIFRGMQSYNAESIKSLEGFDIAWVEEAQTLSQKSLDMLRPTIREEGSEIWFCWNPSDPLDPVDRFFRGAFPPTDSIIIEAKWRENPWFPQVLRLEMKADMDSDPAKAAHVWGGDYEAAPKGSYFADLLGKAFNEGRISHVPQDPILETHVAFDLGNGPNMTMVYAQFVGREVRVIECQAGDDDAANEGWPWYIRKLRAKSYSYGKMILPHDARTRQRVTGKGDEQTLITAGFRTMVVPRMDPGERVKLIQRFLPTCWIDDRCTEFLRAMKLYRADYDEKMQVYRGPLHDWTSHYADAFGHLAQAYEAPRDKAKAARVDLGAAAWMG